MAKIKTVAMDDEIMQFASDVATSIRQIKGGEGNRTTPAMIIARRGRPLGSVKVSSKVQTAIRLDPEVLARWRASGPGWQTRAAQLLAANAP